MIGAQNAAFLGVVALLTFGILWRELPLQYVLTVTIVIYGISALGYWMLKEDSWWLPLIVLNSRGVSRLVLLKWRERPYYGWWLIGLTAVLSFILAPHWLAVLLTLLMQLAALPWLTKRRPGKEAPSYFAALNWLLLAIWILAW